MAAWLALGLVLGLGATTLRLTGIALAVAAGYGGYYGLIEVSGARGLPPPGRRWQVPQTMLVGASVRRRVLVWGAILGPGFVTRNPYAGFGLLPLAVAAMPGAWAGLALGGAIGVAHGTARAVALLRDVRVLRLAPELAGASVPAAIGTTSGSSDSSGPAQAVTTHLDLLLKTVYWRRLDGVVLAAVAVTAAVASVHYVS